MKKMRQGVGGLFEFKVKKIFNIRMLLKDLKVNADDLRILERGF
jgi:hypothetical protein